MTRKRCSKCKKTKGTSQFHTQRRWRDRIEYYSMCKVCWRQYVREYRSSDKWLVHRFNRDYRGKAHITIEEYAALHRKQKGLCAICHGPPSGRFQRLAIDHDHATGAIRGLLCSSCNMGLGYFKDAGSALRAAARYLQKFK